MENDKIIQICPCPQGFHLRQFDDDNLPYTTEIVGLALVEDKFGNRTVKLLEVDNIGQVGTIFVEGRNELTYQP